MELYFLRDLEKSVVSNQVINNHSLYIFSPLFGVSRVYQSIIHIK